MNYSNSLYSQKPNQNPNNLPFCNFQGYNSRKQHARERVRVREGEGKLFAELFAVWQPTPNQDRERKREKEGRERGREIDRGNTTHAKLLVPQDKLINFQAKVATGLNERGDRASETASARSIQYEKRCVKSVCATNKQIIMANSRKQKNQTRASQ